MKRLVLVAVAALVGAGTAQAEPQAMVASAHPVASEAGLATLEARVAALTDAGVRFVRVLYADLHGIPRGKEIPIGELPAKLPKVLARVTQDLPALKEAAALFESGQIDRASAPAFAKAFDEFLTIHAAMVRSPHPHARIRGIDTSAARAMPRKVAATDTFPRERRNAISSGFASR